jgi:hypothetical protein
MDAPCGRGSVERGGLSGATLENTGRLERPGFARMDRLPIGPQVANLPYSASVFIATCAASGGIQNTSVDAAGKTCGVRE